MVERPGGSVIRSWRLCSIVGAESEMPDSESKSKTGSTARFIHLSRSRISRLAVRYDDHKTTGVQKLSTPYVCNSYYTSKGLIPWEFSNCLTTGYPGIQRASPKEGARVYPTSAGRRSSDRPMATKGRRCNEAVARSSSVASRKIGNTLSPRRRRCLPTGCHTNHRARLCTSTVGLPATVARPSRHGARQSRQLILRHDYAQKQNRNRG